MNKVKIGVVGAFRGNSMIKYCAQANNAEVVAICDIREDLLEKQREKYPDLPIAYYTDFETFLSHDMDAVVLANYANEHAPFAIRCMKAGKHVFSEVLPVQTMKEAVELIECVEETGKIYAYGENYCYMPAPYEMRRLYREGVLGEFEYGEGEYIHNCEPIWPGITYGDPDHWRNNMYANFYCTHSIGPLIHITGLRPVSVVGFEGIRTERDMRCGAKKASLGMEVITLENGGIVKSIHGDLYKGSIWYSVYGGKGRAESAREDVECGDVQTIYVNVDEFSGQYNGKHLSTYKPKMSCDGEEKGFGHGGSDFYTMYNFAEKILGNPEADTIDVYEAMDMFLPGMFAYRSVLQGNMPMEIPNLRDPAEREKWRNDTACTDPKVAGDQLLPVWSKGTPDVPAAVYERIRGIWEEEKNKK
ncbi:MAG: Gfo/Idh/MocA family oxidoreductase [Clostridia bacterium]|nr:Gfo/Idh/MocA family oxidoreductase [Clostridia bacterium]